MSKTNNVDESQLDSLAPCPFCFGPGQSDFIVDTSYIIECYSCGARTDTQDGPEEAVRAWNRRDAQVSDEDFAAIVKSYEDAGDEVNADIIRRQWAAARARPAATYQPQGAMCQPGGAMCQPAVAAPAVAAEESSAKNAAQAHSGHNETQLDELLGRYWEIAYSEGATGESRGSEAQEVLSQIRATARAAKALAIDTFVGQPFALIPGYRLDSDQPALACFTGSAYEFADGDSYERQGDSLAGFQARFMTLPQLEEHLFSAEEKARNSDALAPGRVQSVDTLAPRSTQSEAAGAAQPSRSNEKVQELQERAGWNTKQWYEHVGAWETSGGFISFGSVMAVRAMLIQFGQVATQAQAAETASVMLWLYRRLPRRYGRPPDIERVIKRLARQAGIDVAECLAERGPDPKGECGEK